jgi:hypothetical protein
MPIQGLENSILLVTNTLPYKDVTDYFLKTYRYVLKG